MNNTHSTYSEEFFRQQRAKQKRSRVSVWVERTAIVLLISWLWVALFIGLSGGF